MGSFSVGLKVSVWNAWLANVRSIILRPHDTNVDVSTRTWQSSTLHITSASPYWRLKRAIWKSRGQRGNVGTVESPSTRRTPLLTQVGIKRNVTIRYLHVAFGHTLFDKWILFSYRGHRPFSRALSKYGADCCHPYEGRFIILSINYVDSGDRFFPIPSHSGLQWRSLTCLVLPTPQLKSLSEDP